MPVRCTGFRLVTIKCVLISEVRHVNIIDYRQFSALLQPSDSPVIFPIYDTPLLCLIMLSQTNCIIYYIFYWTRNRDLHPYFTTHRTRYQCNFTSLIYQLKLHPPKSKSTKTVQLWLQKLQDTLFFIFMLIYWSVYQRIARYLNMDRVISISRG